VTDLATIGDAVDALTNPILVREPIYDRQPNRHRKLTRLWTATVPSLLDQLQGAVIPGLAYVEDSGGHVHTTPRSVPPARLDAISALLRIEVGVTVWCNRADLLWRHDLTATMRALVGGPFNSDDQADLLADLRRWHGWAATLSGWQRAPWRPDVPCPSCEVKHTLRVRVERKTAVCVECGAYWTEDTISLLGEIIIGLQSRPKVDTRALRTDAVLARRAWDDRRRAHATRPDLPYVPS
jgi:hypothetical protein